MKNKTAIIFCGDLKYCPFITRYIERLEGNHLNYEVLFWERTIKEKNLPENYKAYQRKSNLNQNAVTKLLDFFRFRSWCLERIKEDNISTCIVLTTLTAVLLCGELKKRKIPYLFDIRDYSYENIRFFYKIEESAIKNSSVTVISSKGFKSFLPKNHEYVIAHNFNRNDIKRKYGFQKHTGRINIVWNGVMRFFAFQRRYLDALGNDDRFQLIYHGAGPEFEDYKKYCEDNNIRNVQFTGTYDNRDKEALLQNADILNNAYGYEDGEDITPLKYAVSNKYYDGIIYHIPQIVEPGDYKAHIVEKNGVGVSIAPDENLGDRLYEYYQSIDEENFDVFCEKALAQVIREDDRYIKTIDDFIGEPQKS